MKKIAAVLLLGVILAGTAAMAEVDLSGLTFAELAALRDQCQAEMMKRDEWQEVVVPQGIWEVGTQIPAGTWVVKCHDSGRSSIFLAECDIYWGPGYPDDGLFWSYDKAKGRAFIYNPENRFYKGEMTEYIIKLEKGDYISIENQHNKAVFSPYTGINLGFK